jgi:hypothetical protein
VWLDAVIGKRGHGASVQSISGNPVLVDAAKDAVLQWVYQPTLLNGEPMEMIMKMCVPLVRRLVNWLYRGLTFLRIAPRSARPRPNDTTVAGSGTPEGPCVLPTLSAIVPVCGPVFAIPREA